MTSVIETSRVTVCLSLRLNSGAAAVYSSILAFMRFDSQITVLSTTRMVIDLGQLREICIKQLKSTEIHHSFPHSVAMYN